jgi:RND family efflux transporter MFP subunit
LKKPDEEMSQQDDLGFDLPEVGKKGGGTRVLAASVVVVVGISAAFVAGYLPKRAERQQLLAEAKTGTTDERPRVDVTAAKESSSDRAVALPGSTAALEETLIYPRTSGYVRKWYVDIGDKVKEGDLLCEIDTPELDREIDAARADYNQANATLLQTKANQKLAHLTDERTKRLAPAGLATQQESDEKEAAALVADANVGVAEATSAAKQATLNQLLATKSFARVSAPFSGTITARTIERGTLVSAGNTTSLFRLVATDTIRVWVQVPQDLAVDVRPGLAAKVSVREYPGKTFDGKVAHTQSVLDATSRTMTTEVRVPNGDGKLLAGMYANVTFGIHGAHRVWMLPSTALIADAKGVHLAVIDAESRVKFVPIVVEYDDGTNLAVASGLQGTERVVKNPGARLSEGIEVEVVAPAKQEK